MKRKRCVDLLLELEPEGRARYRSWLHQRCKMEWQWRMPTSAAEPGELRAMTGQMLRLEQAFLEDVAEYAQGADNRVRTRLREVWAGV